MEARNSGGVQEVSTRAADDLAELRAARRRLVLEADADRRWIERELHDGVQQHLVALAVNLQVACALVETDPVEANALLEQMRRDVMGALEELSSLALRIHPPVLEAGGLAAALRAVLSGSGSAASVDVRTEASHPPEVVATVYRCCLAVIGRVDTHVSVEDRDGALAFEIVADGPPPTALDGLRDRVVALGGTLTVESTDADATRVCGSLPSS